MTAETTIAIAILITAYIGYILAEGQNGTPRKKTKAKKRLGGSKNRLAKRPREIIRVSKRIKRSGRKNGTAKND